MNEKKKIYYKSYKYFFSKLYQKIMKIISIFVKNLSKYIVSYSTNVV